uniref:B30.2/SPRY domain-containing protein n=1 Tax=Calidris pygmaea TaxID=425635 RepID=A0A8C3J306_9CHAR
MSPFFVFLQNFCRHNDTKVRKEPVLNAISCILNAALDNTVLLHKQWLFRSLFRWLLKSRNSSDVTLDPDTNHPRLEISDDGKTVQDTGTIRKVPRNEKRFDSHTFLLRSSWALGIARESVTRKGTLTLSPKNGFWVMGCTDGREYWAYTEPWTRLSVGGKLPKIGIFLDISAKQLSFHNVHKKAALYTFTIGGESGQTEKFFPFFSTGPATAKPDTEPLKIVWVFDDDDDE